MLIVLISLFSMISFSTSSEKTIFTYRQAESTVDQRYNYDKEVLHLALLKTEAKYGPFELKPSPSMNFARSITYSKKNAFPNFFIKLSYEDRYADMEMNYVRFPVDLGIVGYRVCFTNKAGIKAVEKVSTMPELKKLTHGQGLDWSDVRILRHSGFKVEEIGNYENLFSMVANGRFDLFCRGTNEILDEWKAHKHIPNFVLDKSITIVYPLPRFFFTHASNKKSIQRIQEGLILAYNDGSLQKAWEKNYLESIKFVGLHKRKVFNLENPMLKKIDFNYKKYFYNPFK